MLWWLVIVPVLVMVMMHVLGSFCMLFDDGLLLFRCMCTVMMPVIVPITVFVLMRVIISMAFVGSVACYCYDDCYCADALFLFRCMSLL